jgi:hypothetical protein
MVKKIKIIYLSLLFFFIFSAVFLPKLIIKHDAGMDEADVKTAIAETEINYLDKPLIRFFAIETRAYKNDSGNISVDIYTLFGIKLGSVEFLPEGNSQAEWFF